MKAFLFLFFIWVVGASFSDFWESILHPRLSHTPKFSGSKFFSVQIGLNNVTGHIGCFGDFDSDRYTDIFVVDDSNRLVTIYFWKTMKWQYEMGFQISINVTITNLAAADLNNDGRLDLLVQGTTEGDTQNHIQWYRGDYNTLVFEAILPTSVGQVSIMDSNADLRPDLLGQRMYNGTVQRFYWLNQGSGTFVLKIAEDLFPHQEFDPLHSNAFVDLDGDCLADLIVSTKPTEPQIPIFQIFINTKGTFVHTFSPIWAVQGAGQLSFADFDGDGTIDIVFPVCFPAETCLEDNSIHVIYNVQKKLCQGSIDTSDCRSQSDLCVVDSGWHFEPFNTSSSQSVVVVPKSAFGNSVFLTGSLSPLKLRTGDYNLDGYPDLLFATKKDNNPSQMEIWESVPCTLDLKCSQAAVDGGRRTFTQVAADVVNDLYNVKGAFAAVFYDLDEDGINDILVLAEEVKNNKTIHTIHGIFNNVYIDAYFFKTLALNGVCTQWCSDSVVPDPKPYGVNQYGATMKFCLDDLNGVTHATAVGQLSQSSHLALQTPYTLNGLGRPSNYILYFYCGVPYASTNPHWYQWPGLIPNSQIVGIPYPPEDPSSWQIDLYLSPSGMTLWICVAVLGWLLIVGIAIAFLTHKERKQDEEEKKKLSYLFAFKAL